MEILSTEFFSALLAIVVIDLVLAGDNAIVIALAARGLPPALQKRAVVWGTVGAIVVRSLMTMVVVWLLQVPGLMLAGGVLLVWIAYKLLASDGGDDKGHGPTATTFWGAMQTIVIADAVMGLDNVLAVAGAAHGSYLLVVLGLLISVPIVIWGSSLILKWIERFPAIVYVGAAVLAGTAAKMILGEPLLAPTLEEYGFVVPLTYLLIIGGVLGGGWLRSRRGRKSRVVRRPSAKAAAVGPVSVTQSSTVSQGGPAMQRILVPVDDSRNAQFAVRHVITQFMQDSAREVHLLNVQAPLTLHAARFASRRDRDDWHRAAAERALAPARALLEQHGVPHSVHYKTGERASVIVAEARRLRCHRIVLGTSRKNSLARLVEDSTTNKVLERTTVPVEVIAGESVPMLERWGIPAGVGAAIALLALAVD